MTTISNSSRSTIATSFVGLFVFFAMVIPHTVLAEEDFGSSYYSPSDYGSADVSCCTSADFGSSYYSPDGSDFGSSYYSPDGSDFGSSYYSPDGSDFGSSYYSPEDFGSSYYSPEDFGSSYYSPADSYSTTDIYGTAVVDEYGVGYSYHDYGTGYTPDGTGYSSTGYTASASMPFSFRAPSTSYAPNYPQPRPQPQPQPQPQRPVQQQPQQQQQQQQQQGGGPINIVNTNNNNNVNNNNLVNSAPVTPVVYSGVTYPIQYVYQQQPVYQPTYPVYPTYPTYPTYNAPYCTITATQGSITNGQPAYLTWSSSGATSAWLSDGIGSVSTNGSLAVRPNVSKTYTLTVSGQGGTNTCSTYVTVQGSYITLSQIPYTGFDAGPFGNAIYWFSLISFAIAGAYLAVYYLPTLKLWQAGNGGAMALVGSMLGSRKVTMHEAPVQVPVETKVEAPVETMTPSPIQIDSIENLPVAPTAKSTMDSMVVVHSKEGEAPRIIITRT